MKHRLSETANSWLRRIRFLAVLAFCALGFGMCGEFASAQDDERGPVITHRLLIGDDIKEKRSEIRQVEKKLSFLRELDAVIARIEFEPPTEFPRRQVWENSASEVKTFLEFEGSRNVSAEYTIFLTALLREMEPLQSISGRVQRELYDLREVYGRESYEARLIERVSRPASRGMADVYKELVDNSSGWEVILDEDFSANWRFFRNLDEHVEVSHVEDDLRKLLPLLEISAAKVNEEITTHAERAVEALRRSYAKEVATERARLEAQMEDLHAEFTELLEEAERYENEEKRESEINQNLVYAIYGMIGALVLLFFSLRVFSESVAKELIGRRSLVEVIGMAFVIITIIILGTGEKLEKEVLGTLLGTIAGYIFARTVQRSRPEE